VGGVWFYRGGSRSETGALLDRARASPLTDAARFGARLSADLAETVIGLFKTEVIRRRGPWRSLEAVEFATLAWVDWFNHRRLLEPIGYVPPAEYEERYYATAAVA
jgi:transposase InsO family protein